jgi:hypothetical protein
MLGATDAAPDGRNPSYSTYETPASIIGAT